MDLIQDGIPIEVKVTPKLTRALRSFITTYSPPLAIIVNTGVFRREMLNDTPVYCVPAVLLP